MDVNHLHSPEFWLKFAPQLHIDDPGFLKNLRQLNPPAKQLEEFAELIRIEGYKTMYELDPDLQKFAEGVIAEHNPDSALLSK